MLERSAVQEPRERTVHFAEGQGPCTCLLQPDSVRGMAGKEGGACFVTNFEWHTSPVIEREKNPPLNGAEPAVRASLEAREVTVPSLQKRIDGMIMRVLKGVYSEFHHQVSNGHRLPRKDEKIGNVEKEKQLPIIIKNPHKKHCPGSQEPEGALSRWKSGLQAAAISGFAFSALSTSTNQCFRL